MLRYERNVGEIYYTNFERTRKSIRKKKQNRFAKTIILLDRAIVTLNNRAYKRNLNQVTK